MAVSAKRGRGVLCLCETIHSIVVNGFVVAVVMAPNQAIRQGFRLETIKQL